MVRNTVRAWAAAPLLVMVAAAAHGDEPAAVQRGRTALTTRAFVPATWTLASYEQVWKRWEPALKAAPAEYDAALRDQYGLHEAPFPNGRYPMGMRLGRNLFGGQGLTVDCMLCHGGSIFGKSMIGLGNASLDIQAFYEDFGAASGGGGKTPFVFGNMRGTSEAGAMAVYLFGFREPDLKLHLPPHDLGLPLNLCEDVPAWWHLRKKKTMYHTGTSDARSVRSIMQFMMTPDNGPKTFAKEEPVFRDIQAFLKSLEAPKYPFPVDTELAHRGEKLFTNHCARCHGTYGAEPTYPNRVVPLEEIGTDPNRLRNFTRQTGEFYNKSWFAQETGTGYLVTEPKGYQAPPLDGVWATAPYFHNGSVPTLADVLDSTRRPKIYTRSFRTGVEDYDREKVGWKVEVLKSAPAADLPKRVRHRVYDTNRPGLGNGGHTFGDRLSVPDRRALIEYLKTL